MAADDLAYLGQPFVARALSGALDSMDWAYQGQPFVTNVGDGGATNYTTQPGAGSVTATGQLPALAATDNHYCIPDTALIVVTGQAPAAGQAVFAQTGAGALVADGQAPLMAVAHIATPAAETLTVSGQAPGIRQAHNISPGSSALAIAADPPAATFTDNQVAQPGADTLVMVGNPPSIKSAVIIAVGSDSISVTPSAPQAQIDVFVQPGSATVVVDPYIPGVRVGVQGRLLGRTLARPACGGGGRIAVGLIASGIRAR